MEDLEIKFDNKNKLKDLTEEEERSSMKNIIQDHEVKQYFYKKHI